ncbi:hypothetical protein FEM48_Zijuj01G0246500 [Ziziphus jujuba var. spinosa]|uniref:DUF4283 domain-containing protein n=1 Tax=Ziziphus jujuba var. spinosa TaxID=714518 RepID=A0A978W4I3_ZIZJJ|nr:hypothetical protein FEM48_Zijuj01G0246500 [Ziziphus jujuba var. spinosa]
MPTVMKTMGSISDYQGALEVIDLRNGYYLVKLPTWEDHSRVLSEGPWVIAGHYLSVQSWKPEFNPLTDRIHHMALWVRLPYLLDPNTEMANRGRFARICVEVDISKPLIRKLIVGSRIQHVEYEGGGIRTLLVESESMVRGSRFRTGKEGPRDWRKAFFSSFKFMDMALDSSILSPSNSVYGSKSLGKTNLLGWIVFSTPDYRKFLGVGVSVNSLDPSIA